MISNPWKKLTLLFQSLETNTPTGFDAFGRPEANAESAFRILEKKRSGNDLQQNNLNP
jgi:hypothetical protein